jgi:uncharacterized protein (DUF362 family)
MDRREFLKKSAMLGFGAGLMFLPKGLRGPAELAAQEASYPDLVAVRGSSSAAMFESGIRAIGGMGRFVKKGQTVLIKPNMSWDLTAEYAANTSPDLVAAVVRHCIDAGAKKVLITDHSLDQWEHTLRTIGVLSAAVNAGAVYANADKESYYHKVSLNGKILKETKIHEALLESDVFINVPVLKNHSGVYGLTASIKNLMGCIWDRNAYHRDGLQTCLVDFLYAKKPHLNIVDGDRIIARGGPRGGNLANVAQLHNLVISPDIVAADTAASMMAIAALGQQIKGGPAEHIRLAGEAGFGQTDLSKLNIQRLTV